MMAVFLGLFPITHISECGTHAGSWDEKRPGGIGRSRALWFNIPDICGAGTAFKVHFQTLLKPPALGDGGTLVPAEP